MRSEPKHAATMADEQPRSQRRTFLDVLAMELRRTFGFEADVVMREGSLVLYAAAGGPMRSVEIGCDMTNEGWWFTWFGGGGAGRTIAPAGEVARTACVIARELRVSKTGPS